jgi:hypothetical protein
VRITCGNRNWRWELQKCPVQFLLVFYTKHIIINCTW